MKDLFCVTLKKNKNMDLIEHMKAVIKGLEDLKATHIEGTNLEFINEVMELHITISEIFER